MTTALADNVVVAPNGITKVCAWCVSPARLTELNRLYTVSHSLVHVVRRTHGKRNRRLLMETPDGSVAWIFDVVPR